MSLESFLNYRDSCPLCHHKLELMSGRAFLSFSHEQDELIIVEEFSGWKLSKRKFTYNVELRINKKTHDFNIEFQDEAGNPLNSISIEKMEEYKDQCNRRAFWNGLTQYCKDCKRYQYGSYYLQFNFAEAKVVDYLGGNIEEFFLAQKTPDDQYKIYLLNKHSNGTLVKVGKMNEKEVNTFEMKYGSIQWHEKINMTVDMPGFTFSDSLDKTMERLDKLLFFS